MPPGAPGRGRPAPGEEGSDGASGGGPFNRGNERPGGHNSDLFVEGTGKFPKTLTRIDNP